jgi:hypothetical protein
MKTNIFLKPRKQNDFYFYDKIIDIFGSNFT